MLVDLWSTKTWVQGIYSYNGLIWTEVLSRLQHANAHIGTFYYPLHLHSMFHIRRKMKQSIVYISLYCNEVSFQSHMNHVPSMLCFSFPLDCIYVDLFEIDLIQLLSASESDVVRFCAHVKLCFSLLYKSSINVKCEMLEGNR